MHLHILCRSNLISKKIKVFPLHIDVVNTQHMQTTCIWYKDRRDPVGWSTLLQYVCESGGVCSFEFQNLYRFSDLLFVSFTLNIRVGAHTYYTSWPSSQMHYSIKGYLLKTYVCMLVCVCVWLSVFAVEKYWKMCLWWMQRSFWIVNDAMSRRRMMIYSGQAWFCGFVFE